MFLTSGKNIFCFRAAKFVSATYVSRAAKLGNLCVHNNVSATMFPSLARPLQTSLDTYCTVVQLALLLCYRVLLALCSKEFQGHLKQLRHTVPV